MYAAVPAIVPSAVRVTSASDTSALARPKSSSLADRRVDAARLPRHQDVSGLEIPVQDAAAMCRLECVRNLQCETQRFLDVQRAAQRGALDVLEHQIARPGSDVVAGFRRATS